MPYLRVDLDGKKKWPLVARGLGLDVANVGMGFLELWEMCWRERIDSVSVLQLECLFGAPGERVAIVLSAFDFLEHQADGRWRVRGAATYLQVSEANSAGGKKRAKGAKRDAKGRLLSSGSPATAGGSTSSTPAPDQPLHQSPNTIHHTPIKNIAGDEHPPGWKPLVDALFGKYVQVRGGVPSPRGKDWKALKALRERLPPNSDEEIVIRWGRGLTAQFKERVDSFFDLDDRWDSLTGSRIQSRDVRKDVLRAEDSKHPDEVGEIAI